MRGKALQDTSALPPGDHAARNFRVGQTYAAAAMLKEAADAFEKAARDSGVTASVRRSRSDASTASTAC